MSALRLTIVIPTFNEAPSLAGVITHAQSIADEVIVSDGGSTDDSTEIARQAGARVVEGPLGRGGQLNRGAALAQSDVLLFLHADSALPADGRVQIERAVEDGYAGGGSRIKFDVAGSLLRFGAGWINGRTRLTRLPLGDQAQFVRRDVFEQLEGFRDWPILEDLDFMRRLKRRHRVVVLAGPVVTSSRRFRQGGLLKTIAINWTIWGLYALGFSPQGLSRLYRRG